MSYPSASITYQTVHVHRTNRTSILLLAFAGLLALQLVGIAIGWRVPGLTTEYVADLWRTPILLLVVVSLTVIALRIPAARWRQAIFESSALRFHGTLFLIAFALYASIAWWVYGGIPRIDDGVSAVFQSRIFLEGLVVLPPPPEPDFFRLTCTIGPWSPNVEGAPPIDWWCGMYPPGWSLLALPFVATNTAWLLNPILGAALIPATAWLAREAFADPAVLHRRTGRIAALILLTSPFLATLAGTHLSHILTALCLVLSVAAILRILNTFTLQRLPASIGFAILAGGAFHLAFLTRSLTAGLLGLLFGIAVIIRWRDALRALLPLAIAALLAGSALLSLGAYQQQITGDWKTPGHKPGLGDWGTFGLGVISDGTGRDPFWKHTPTKSLRHTLGRLQAANDKTTGWPLGLLPILLLPWVIPTTGRPDRWKVAWLTCFPAALLFFFAFYWYEEVYWRGRYLFAGLPFLVIAAARGLSRISFARRGSRPIAIGAVVFAIAVALPMELRKLAPPHGDIETRLLPTVTTALAADDIESAIVHIGCIGRGDESFDALNDYYASGFLRNRLPLESNPVLYVQDRGPENPHLWKHFPERTAYRYVIDRATMDATLTRLSP